MRELLIVGLLAIALLGSLSGCGAQRLDVPEAFARRLVEPAQSLEIPEVTGDIGELRQEVKASANLTQNSIAGLGANLGKLSETVQGFGGDLAHVSLALRGSIEAQAQVAAELKAQVQAQVAARAELQALAGAQAGLKNELEQLSQTARAGRDAVQTTTQFSKEMAQTLQRESLGTVVIVVVMAGLMIWDKERSRKRADQRAAATAEHLAALRESPGGKIGLGNGHLKNGG